MSKSITQDMAYRQSLMKYAEKYGVSRASRKYNKSRSYIYFWKQRWDGSAASLACHSKRPHSHPNQHTEAELKLIRDMRRRNPRLGLIEFWDRLRKRGYTRRPESLYRVMRKMGLFPAEKPKNTYKPKPYEQMSRPGERVQVDVKVVPRSCIADPELRLYQYTAIDELTRVRFLDELFNVSDMFVPHAKRSGHRNVRTVLLLWNFENLFLFLLVHILAVAHEHCRCLCAARDALRVER